MTTMLIKFRPIILGVLAATVFLVVMALFGMALSISIVPNLALPFALKIASCLIVVALVLVGFAISGAITCMTAPKLSKRLVIAYTLSAWALLSCMIAAPTFLITLTGLDLVHKPYIHTDINVLRTNAITTLILDPTPTQKPPAEARFSPIAIMAAWSMLTSLTLGLYASLRAGDYVYKRKWVLGDLDK